MAWTKQQFGQVIKQKYPQYASMDDVTLADQMLMKYPQYDKYIDKEAEDQADASTYINQQVNAQAGTGTTDPSAYGTPSPTPQQNQYAGVTSQNNPIAGQSAQLQRPPLSSLVKPKEESTISKVGNFGVNLIKGLFSAPQRFGEAVGKPIGLRMDQKRAESMQSTDIEQINKNIALARKLESQGNKKGAKMLLEQNKKLSQGMQGADKVDEYSEQARKGKQDIVKGAVGTGAFFVPGGSTPLPRIASGVVTGGMAGYGASEEGKELPGIVGGAVVGGAISGGIEAVGAGYKFLRNLSKKPGKNLATSLAKELGGASPSQWQRASEEHGVDLNELIKKYYPPGSTYDDILGSIKDRGNGGVFQKLLSDAEKKIQATNKAAGTNLRISGDDIIVALKEEQKIINKELGTGARAKAMDNVIKQVIKKYKNGASLNQVLDTVRYANKKFGKNIASETAGDAIATAAQKAEANSLKKIVKSMFPELKEALRTQEEVLTLKPILSRARAIMNTQGSSIRAGARQFDLSKPFTWGQPAKALIAGTPQAKSKFLQAGTKGLLPDIGEKATNFANKKLFNVPVGNIPGAAKQIGTIKATESLSKKPMPDISQDINYGKGYENTQVQSQHDTSIAQNYLTGKSPEEWYKEYQNAIYSNAPESAVSYFKDQWENETAYQEDNATTTKEGTPLTQIQQNLVRGGKRNYDALINKFGVLDAQGNLIDVDLNAIKVGTITGGKLNPIYKAMAEKIINAILRPESGAAIPPEEMDRYIQTYLPMWYDDKETALYKLEDIKQHFAGLNVQ